MPASLEERSADLLSASKLVLSMFMSGHNPTEQQLGRLEGAIMGADRSALSPILAPSVGELPPLDISNADWEEAHNRGGAYSLVDDLAELACRERQLIEAYAIIAQRDEENKRLRDLLHTRYQGQ